MEFNQFKEKAFEAALKNGCDAAELYFVEGDSFSAMVLEQELDSYSVSRERGLNLRGQEWVCIHRKPGCAGGACAARDGQCACD